MPRRTPVKELEKEVSVVSSPLRRSSRISNNSPAPTKIATRRSSASETTSSSTPKATRGRRSSFSQELESAKENDTDSKTAKVTTTSRPRRGSLSSKNSEDSTEESVPKRTTRASSVTKEEPTEVKKPVTRRRRSASEEVEEEQPSTKTTRRTSLSKKNEKTETKNIEENGKEPEKLEVSTPIKRLDSIEEVTKESDSPNATTSKPDVAKKIKTDNVDLSIIEEVSLTEEDIPSEEDSKSLQAKLGETLETESEDKEKTDTVMNKAVTEDLTVVAKEGFEEKKVPEVESTSFSNGEKPETPKKVDNHSSVPEKSSVLEDTNEVISPQGNKENISPKKKAPEPECEPMEVDEPDLESSLSKSLHTQSPVLQVSKIQDVSKELEITEKVTDEIDEFLKDEVKYSPKFSNSVKKSRLSLNRSSSSKDEKKEEALLKDTAVDQNAKEVTGKEDEKIETEDKAPEKKEEPVQNDVALDQKKEIAKEVTEIEDVDETPENKEVPDIAIDQKEEDTKEASGEDVSQEVGEETQLSPEKEVVLPVDSQDDSEDSFHLELTETKSFNDSVKIDDSKQDKHETIEGTESAVRENGVMEDKKEDTLDKSSLENNAEKSFNLENTDYKDLNTSTDITKDHIEEIAANPDTENVSIERTEDHKDNESTEVAIETELSKSDSILKEEPESVKEDIEKKVDENELVTKEEIAEETGKSIDTSVSSEKSNKENSVEETESVASAKKEENLEKEKTEAAVKKSPVNVISDIVIQPAIVKDDTFKKISPQKSVSLEEKSPGSIEADSTQTEEDDEVFVKLPYKSPEKRVRSKSLFQQVCTGNNSSDEEEITTKEGSRSNDEIVIVSDNENEENEQVTKSEDEDKEIMVSSESETEVKESEKSKLNKPSPNKTLITMQQNVKAGDDTEKCLSDRIHKVVDLFCAGISNTKDVSINVSLEFSGHFSDSENETKSKKDTIDVSLQASASKEESKEPTPDKGSKRRKLYNPNKFQYPIDCQNEEEGDKIRKPKKSATFDESHNSSSSPPKNPDGEELSPLKAPRSYKNTPYKSGKGSPVNKKEKTPEKKRKLSEEGASLKYLLFSTDSNSESEHDSTWVPSREVSSCDETVSSFSSEDLTSEGESFRIVSPISGILVTESENNEHDDSQETSFNYSRSPRPGSVSPANKTKSPKKRRSSENQKNAEEPEKKKVRTSLSPGKKQRKQLTSESEEEKEETKEKEERKSTSFGKKKRSLTNKDRKIVEEKNVGRKSTSPGNNQRKQLTSENEEEKEETKEKEGRKSTSFGKKKRRSLTDEDRKTVEEMNVGRKSASPAKTKQTFEEENVEKKNVWDKEENAVFVQPTASSTAEKKVKKPPKITVSKISTTAENKVKKPQKIIVSKVSTKQLKVSTTECGKKTSKKEGKKNQFLKPSTCMKSSDWSVKKFLLK